MFKDPTWHAIESPQEWQRLRQADQDWHSRTVCFEDTEWNRRFRDFVGIIITTKQFPPLFPTKELLIAEAERRTEFILASNPSHIAPTVLDDILDELLGVEWRSRTPISATVG